MKKKMPMPSIGWSWIFFLVAYSQKLSRILFEKNSIINWSLFMCVCVCVVYLSVWSKFMEMIKQFLFSVIKISIDWKKGAIIEQRLVERTKKKKNQISIYSVFSSQYFFYFLLFTRFCLHEWKMFTMWRGLVGWVGGWSIGKKKLKLDNGTKKKNEKPIEMNESYRSPKKNVEFYPFFFFCLFYRIFS